MAGARRHRTPCSFFTGLRDHNFGDLFSNFDHAACAGFQRRGVCIPSPRCRTQDVLGLWILLRLSSCDVCTRNGAWRVHPGLRGPGPSLYRIIMGFFRSIVRWCLGGVVLAIGIVSIWTPVMNENIANRWFSWPNIAFFSPVPVITALLTFTAWRSLNRRTEIAPFASAVGLFLIAYLGIAISLWPMIVPYHYSLWEAASAQSTQAFLAVGTLFLLPVILMYTAWSYWVFRGKVRADIGYH